MSTPSEEQNMSPERPHLDRDATLDGPLERKSQLRELWQQPLRLLGPLEHSAHADAELGEITYDDFRKIAEDPDTAARFERLRADSEARTKRWLDTYAALHTPASGKPPHDREQHQSVTPQQPGHSSRR
ncbi:hypothetical protein [Streptomyces sp. NPDC058371]|uniref:hypothetical protein n=1 Tax=Streptomyces sp. NPDC058371 TaxID=3346463 RepID=UPI0036479D2E